MPKTTSKTKTKTKTKTRTKTEAETDSVPVSRPVLEVIGGVDTHADVHCVAALDQLGGLLGTTMVPATAQGYRQGLDWLAGFGPLGRVGVEGTGSYGAGLSRAWTAAGVRVVEVNRPDRAARRARGKSDPVDAEQAARSVLAGTATGQPKTRDGIVEAIRVIHTVRRGALKARTAAVNEFTALLVTAPDRLRAELAGRPRKAQLAAAAAFRPGDLTDPAQAVKLALRRLARRIHHLDVEIGDATAELDQLTRQAAPPLRASYGVGPDSAAQLLITAGDNPDRLGSEAGFAALCGASPIPASSGKTTRHRLNRGGDRQANRALYTIAITRMGRHQPTRDYIAKTTARGKTKKEAIRLLKRHLARELYHILTPATTLPTARLTVRVDG
jgi:transposase